MTNEVGFSLIINGSKVHSGDPQMVNTASHTIHQDGISKTVKSYVHQPTLLEVDCHTYAYEHTSLMEQWLTIRNPSPTLARIEHIDSIVIRLPLSFYELMSYKSCWGAEFESVMQMLVPGETFILETKKGRSSQDAHPWFALYDRKRKTMISASVMWSGNWAFQFTKNPLYPEEVWVSGGLSPWQFWKDLSQDERMESPHVVLVTSEHDDLNEISTQYARVGRAYWYPKNELSKRLPVEWNHWWSYEDKAVNEQNFLENVEVSARLGIDVCTLDAGWFGPTDPDTFWYDYRGDWDLVNTTRFPRGLRVVSDIVHERGMKFGLWCEIEAIGQYAKLNHTHPQVRAEQEGTSLGYVCLGNSDAREWAYQTLDRLITEYNCDWIKLDFNLDPQAGCTRTDHGHGAGDGLFEHYQGYYEVLQKIREKHPEVVLESCASGGLRIDLGLMRHTHTTFLSDPDWPEHSLQLFWAATTMLAPDVCLHWSYCEWLGEHQKQLFNPADPQLTMHQIDYYTRISMLGGFGFSQRMPNLPDWVSKRYAYHIKVYQELVADFVRTADVYRLTDQPKRFDRGERWASFQYRKPHGNEHLIFVFRLTGNVASRTIHLQQLDSNCSYELTYLTSQQVVVHTGEQLMNCGLTFTDFAEEQSELMVLRKLG